MRLSTLFGRTLREAPADAEHTAYQLALRAGLVRQALAGSYALMPLGMRVARRIEAIMHEEMARIDGQELRTPVVQSAAVWEKSGRYAEYGPLILQIADRSERALIFAPTHEEAIAALASREITSYRQMPALVYQVHTKYRDELRPKGGLMRMREFTMLDAYSLDADPSGLDRAYERIAGAFERIFARCGVRFLAVEASAGEMGGREPREYMALSPAGEDTLVLCAVCGYAANLEVAVARYLSEDGGRTTNDEGASQENDSFGPSSSVVGQIEEVATPECATIADLANFLGVPESATSKAVFFDTPERGLLFAVIRGDLDVNETKLRAAAGVSELAPASAEQIAAAGAVAGYASPVGLAVEPGTTQRVPGREPGNKEQRTKNKDAMDNGQRITDNGQIGVFVVVDRSVVEAGPLVAGANRAGYHLRNVLYGRDWRASVVADIAMARAGDPCANCGAALAFERGVSYLDPSGAARPVVMGSYGIGIERLLQVIIEQHHDEAGIMWPAEVAPADAHLVRLGKGDAVRTAADALYEELQAAGVRTLYDDRDETAGVKFNDADLIGLPVRLLVGERLLAEGAVEVKRRGGEATKVIRGEVITALRSM
jgi:prolyl-tRNA synthetase